jgi:Ca-activated chloride channel family protein
MSTKKRIILPLALGGAILAGCESMPPEAVTFVPGASRSSAGVSAQATLVAPALNERYPVLHDLVFARAMEKPVSTFSIDVDTAAYSNVRRMLRDGYLPPRDAVRIEEMVNYFDYDYLRPESREVPFAVDLTVMPAPWSGESKLLHLGIKGYDEVRMARPRANLVLLVDVSGSMAPRDRLDLLKRSFRLLQSELDAADSVAIVT